MNIDEDIYVISKSGFSENVIKKSRFIANAEVVHSNEEAASFLSDAKKKYYDSKHICYAFVLMDGTKKFSDDKEPSGTAGKPILECIDGCEIKNCIVTVTRYFGGILLGTGGLMRAYTETAKSAILDAGKEKVTLRRKLMVPAKYSDYEYIKYLLNENGADEFKIEYTDEVQIYCRVPAAYFDIIEKKIQEITSGKTKIYNMGEEIS